MDFRPSRPLYDGTTGVGSYLVPFSLWSGLEGFETFVLTLSVSLGFVSLGWTQIGIFSPEVFDSNGVLSSRGLEKNCRSQERRVRSSSPSTHPSTEINTVSSLSSRHLTVEECGLSGTPSPKKRKGLFRLSLLSWNLGTSTLFQLNRVKTEIEGDLRLQNCR